jgi:hypothetical protein
MKKKIFNSLIINLIINNSLRIQAPLDTVPFFHRVGTQPNGAMGRAVGIASTFTGLIGIFIGIFVAKLVL